MSFLKGFIIGALIGIILTYIALFNDVFTMIFTYYFYIPILLSFLGDNFLADFIVGGGSSGLGIRIYIVAAVYSGLLWGIIFGLFSKK